MSKWSEDELQARCAYLNFPSNIKSFERDGILDSVVKSLIVDLKASSMDVPPHVLALRSPEVTKALGALDLWKAMGGKPGEAKSKVKPEENPEGSPEDQATATDGNGATGKVASPGVAVDSQRAGGAEDEGTGGGGEGAGSSVDDGWDEFFKDPKEVVRAKRMEEPFTVKTLENRGGEVMHGKAGDYLVEGLRGDQWVVDGKIFEETYVNVKKWKSVKQKSDPQAEAAKFDDKPPATNQLGPAKPESGTANTSGPGVATGASQGGGSERNGGGAGVSTKAPTQSGVSAKAPTQSGVSAKAPTQSGVSAKAPTQSGVTPQAKQNTGGSGSNGGVQASTEKKAGGPKRPMTRQDLKGGEPTGDLTVYDRAKGYGIVDNPPADDVFGVYEDEWAKLGTTHFGKNLVNAAEEQENTKKPAENGNGDQYLCGLKSGGKWAGFVLSRGAGESMEVAYLETAPHHRGEESEQVGAGSRLLASVFEKAQGRTVALTAMSETASYFKAVGAKLIGGLKFEFDEATQQKFIAALAADGQAPMQKSMDQMDAYERRKAARQGQGAQPGDLTAQLIYDAEKKLPNGLLVGPVHEAASSRVQRYYNPSQGQMGVTKSLQIIRLK